MGAGGGGEKEIKEHGEERRRSRICPLPGPSAATRPPAEGSPGPGAENPAPRRGGRAGGERGAERERGGPPLPASLPSPAPLPLGEIFFPPKFSGLAIPPWSPRRLAIGRWPRVRQSDCDVRPSCFLQLCLKVNLVGQPSPQPRERLRSHSAAAGHPRSAPQSRAGRAPRPRASRALRPAPTPLAARDPQRAAPRPALPDPPRGRLPTHPQPGLPGSALLCSALGRCA